MTVSKKSRTVLTKLNFSGAVLINLMEEVGQLLIGGAEAHGPGRALIKTGVNIHLMISPRPSPSRKSCFLRSNRSKQFWAGVRRSVRRLVIPSGT